MKDGFIKVAAASPSLRVADVDYNVQEILNTITTANAQGVKVLAFPELCITGYSCGDLFFQDTLIEKAREAVFSILKATADVKMLIVLGCPVESDSKLYNCAIVINNGEIKGIVPKQHLPNYNEFYEQRQFNTLQAAAIPCSKLGHDIAKTLFSVKDYPGLKIGVEICEDLWAVTPPSNDMALQGANLIINISASNEIIGKDSYRKTLVENQSARLVCGYVYANACEDESTQDLIFSGHSMIAENGTILAEKNPFEKGLLISEIDINRLNSERRKNTSFQIQHNINLYQAAEIDLDITETTLTRHISKTPFVPENDSEKAERCAKILTMQSYGLKKRIAHSRAQKLVIGLSGGLDSTLALLVCVKAMALLERPLTDIIAVTMPCFGTTHRTKNNAYLLAEALGVSLKEIYITKAVTQHFEDIGQPLDVFDVTYENGQARERTQVLMDIANKENGLVIGTGDLSELALGWATYNGDHMSMYGVNASVPKTLVRHIVSYYAESATNKTLSDVLFDILDTPVSPELLPADKGVISQKTEDIVGPYILHDFFLYYGIRWTFSPKKVYRIAKYAFRNDYDDKTILKWLRNFYNRFFSQQFKRSCLPDGVKVGTVALSPRGDWRMPSDASSALWLKEIDEIEE